MWVGEGRNGVFCQIRVGGGICQCCRHVSCWIFLGCCQGLGTGELHAWGRLLSAVANSGAMFSGSVVSADQGMWCRIRARVC